MNARWLLLAAGMFAALWPVWMWYAGRMVDDSDEPWGIAALVLALWLLLRDWRPEPIGTERCLAVAGLLSIYALGFGTLPPLVRAMLAVSAAAVIFHPRRGAAGVWTLLLLSLPVLASMQFYLGYPLRVVTATTSAWLLEGSGLDVARAGLTIHWRGESVSVDAPCSGVRMLWGGLVLAAGLCAWTGCRARPTLAVLGTTFAVVMAANVIRATLLFYKEAQVVRLPEWTHAGIGCVCFAAAVFAIFHLPRLFDREQTV